MERTGRGGQGNNHFNKEAAQMVCYLHETSDEIRFIPAGKQGENRSHGPIKQGFMPFKYKRVHPAPCAHRAKAVV
jgi:hypothetical protein